MLVKLDEEVRSRGTCIRHGSTPAEALRQGKAPCLQGTQRIQGILVHVDTDRTHIQSDVHTERCTHRGECTPGMHTNARTDRATEHSHIL